MLAQRQIITALSIAKDQPAELDDFEAVIKLELGHLRFTPGPEEALEEEVLLCVTYDLPDDRAELLGVDE